MKLSSDKSKKALDFKGNIVMVGCGSIAKAVLPIIGQHLKGIYQKMTIISANESGRKLSESLPDFLIIKLAIVLTPYKLDRFIKRV